MEPWQIYHVARKHLGPGLIAKIYGKANVRSAYDWAQNPAYTVRRCRSPLEALHHMLSLLDDYGLGYAARAAIDYLKTAIEDPHDIAAVDDVKATMVEEKLLDYEALARFQAAVDACLPADEVQALKDEAVAEIERTFAKYMDECGRAADIRR